VAATTSTDSARHTTTATRTHRKIHTVQRGQTVSELAEWYGVSQSQLRRWNNLGKTQPIRSRQKLVVFVLDKSAEEIPTRTAVAARPTAVPAATAISFHTPAEVGIVVKAPIVAAPKPTVTTSSPASRPAPTPSVATEVAAAPVAPRAARPVAPKPTVVASEPVAVAAVTSTSDDTLAPTSYVVQRGDNLTKVAREHDVTVAQLKAWNQLTTDQVTLGQKLTLRVSEEDSADTEVAVADAKPTRPAPKAALPRKSLLPKTHLVQPGDTLYNISRRYQGVTVERLRQLNHLKSDDVKPGQKLIVAS